MLKAQQEELKAKRDLAQAKYSYVKNRMQFMQAIGMISEENLAEVNGWLQTPSPEPLKSNENIKHKPIPGLLDRLK